MVWELRGLMVYFAVADEFEMPSKKASDRARSLTPRKGWVGSDSCSDLGEF